MQMNENDRKKETNTPDEPCVFVPNDFINEVEIIIAKLEASRNEFRKATEEIL
jgi:hypothetical protein